MTSMVRSMRQEQRELSAELRGQHKTWVEIAVVLCERYHLNMRAALRVVRDWSQRDAAEHWNRRWPADPKTFKNFSYWENWPSRTGHAPSLGVLARLAELYECSVSDLLGDFADFRHLDATATISRDLELVRDIALDLISGDRMNGDSGLRGVVEWLDFSDVHEIGMLSARLAERIDNVDRRGLFLKVAAGLSLAAVAPMLSGVEAEAAQTVAPTRREDRLSGIWHSRYRYYSTGRKSDFTGEHYVVINHNQDQLSARSLPNSVQSLLALDMTVTDSVVTGTWVERTSPAGYYKGAVYRGAVQLLIDPTASKMSGRWLGFDKESNVNTGDWELVRVSADTSKNAQREFHFRL